MRQFAHGAKQVKKGKTSLKGDSGSAAPKQARASSACTTGAKSPKIPVKQGRPSSYTKAIGDEICERLADGEPLREICRDERMPPWRTVYNWREANPEFAARIARAREMGEEAIAQDCLHIADTPLMGEETEQSESGLKVKRGDMLGHRKLQIETRLKLLAKWNPKKWGEKVDLNHGGQEGNPIQSTTKVVIVPAKQPAHVESRPLKREGEE